MDANSAPSMIAQNRGRVLRNLLPGRDGVLRARSGALGTEPYLVLGAEFYYASPGIWVTPGGTRVVWSYGHTAAIGTTVLKQQTGESGVPTSASTSEAARPGVHHCQVGDLVYGTPDVFRGQQMMPRLDSTVSALTSLVNAPWGAQSCCAHLGRLFVGGGTVPGTTTPVYSDRLYWSDVLGPTADTVAQWSDDVSGLVNQITLPDGGQYITGLAPVGDNLAILTTRAIYMLYGRTPSTFQVRRVATTGCGRVVHQQPLATAEGMYFMADEGYMFFDGSSLTNVSRNMQRAFYEAGRSFFVSHARLDDDYLLVCANTAPSSASAPESADTSPSRRIGSWLFHIPTQTWTTFDSPLMANGGPMLVQRAESVLNTTVMAWDGYRMWSMTAVTAPDLEPALLTGVSSWGGDIYSGSTDLETLPVEWQTRTERLASPQASAVLRRLWVDYRLVYKANLLAAHDAPTFAVTLVDGRGNQIAGPFTLPAQGIDYTLALADRPAVETKRVAFDLFCETDDVYAVVTSAGTWATLVTRAELDDLWVEYDAPSYQQ